MRSNPLFSRARAQVSSPQRLLALLVAATLCLTIGAYAAHIDQADAWWTTQTMFGFTRPNSVPDHDTKAVELGVKFRTAKAGTIQGIRFFKSLDNTGEHTGTLWSRDGQALATLTFTNEKASGWQAALFDKPVAVEAGVTYVASYHTNTGHYYADTHYFGTTGAGQKDIKALASGVDGPNGIYSYGGSQSFPTQDWNSANYWVDAIFQPAPAAQGDKPNATTGGNTDPTYVGVTTTTADPVTTTTAPPETTTTPPTTTPPTTPPPTTTPPTTTPPTTTPPPPPPPGTPGAGNTGVPAGTALTASGGFTVSTAGAVIDAKDITGTVTIAAANVTIKRSRFTGTGQDYAIYVRSGSVRIEDSEISGGYHTAGIAFDNWTAVRLNVHNLPDDGFKLGSNVLLQDSWIHDFSPEPGAHADGAQMQNGVVNTSIIHNYIDIAGNAALFLAPDLGPSTSGPLTIKDNILGGGNYTIYVVDGNNGQYFVGNIAVTGNRFLRNSRYGPTRVNVATTWANNTWMDNGGIINS